MVLLELPAARDDARPARDGSRERIAPGRERSAAGELHANDFAAEKLGLRIVRAAALIGVECIQQLDRMQPEDLAMDPAPAVLIEDCAWKPAQMIKASRRGRLAQKLRARLQELRIGA